MEHGVEGLTGWSENTKQEPPPLCCAPSSQSSLLLSAFPFFKHLDLFLVLQLVFKEKRERGREKKENIKYESDIIGSGLHALPFLANPTKAAGGSSKFLGRADNVEMLTTANLSRVSDLRTTAGDREQARE